MYRKILFGSFLTLGLLIFPGSVNAQYTPPGDPYLGGSDPCEDLPPIPSLGGGEIQVVPCGQNSSTSNSSSGGGNTGGGGGGGGAGGGGRRVIPLIRGGTGGPPPPQLQEPEVELPTIPPYVPPYVAPSIPEYAPPVTEPEEAHAAAPLTDSGPAGIVTVSALGAMSALVLRRQYRQSKTS